MAKRPGRGGGILTVDGERIDDELLIEAEEIASARGNTAIPGKAAVKRVIRELLERRRQASARAREREYIPAWDRSVDGDE